MQNANIPSSVELPSTGKLVRSTVFAVLAAVVLLLIAVLPAEYGIDPTGLGKALGLTRMGEIKVSLAQEADAAPVRDADTGSGQPVSSPEAKAAVPEPEPVKLNTTLLSHEMEVHLAPNEGTEIKVTMAKGRKVGYEWWTNGDRANFDVHGDSEELDINYHNYSKGSAERSKGVIEAAFDGNHGWFWRNRTSEAITVTLQTSGEYTDIKHMK